MATLLDYLIPQTMAGGRAADEFALRQELAKQKNALETLAILAAKPDTFEGASGVPTERMMDLWRTGTGEAWPTVKNEPTGAPPPGMQEPVPGLASNMPPETLAVMRSPVQQVTREMGEKAVAEAMAKIKARETTLANEGTLPAREMQAKAQQIPAQIETLSGILKPYGYEGVDAAAQVVGKYPGKVQAQLQRESHYPPRDTSPKLYQTAEGWLPYDMAIGKQKPPTGGAAAGGANTKLPADVKLAQDFIKRVTPVVTGQVSPMQALILGLLPEAQTNPAMAAALQQGKLPPELKAMYDRSVQIVSEYMKVQQAPAAQPDAGTTSNDPLGIR